MFGVTFLSAPETLFTIPDGDAGTFATLQMMEAIVQRSYHTPLVQAWAAEIVQGADDPVAAVRAYLESVLDFTFDDPTREELYTPERMQEMINTTGALSVDCDDIAIVSAALAGSLGLPVRFVAIGVDKGGPYTHVFTEVQQPQGLGWENVDVSRPWQNLPPGLVQRSYTFPVTLNAAFMGYGIARGGSAAVRTGLGSLGDITSAVATAQQAYQNDLNAAIATATQMARNYFQITAAAGYSTMYRIGVDPNSLTDAQIAAVGDPWPYTPNLNYAYDAAYQILAYNGAAPDGSSNGGLGFTAYLSPADYQAYYVGTRNVPPQPAPLTPTSLAYPPDFENNITNALTTIASYPPETISAFFASLAAASAAADQAAPLTISSTGGITPVPPPAASLEAAPLTIPTPAAMLPVYGNPPLLQSDGTYLNWAGVTLYIDNQGTFSDSDGNFYDQNGIETLTVAGQPVAPQLPVATPPVTLAPGYGVQPITPTPTPGPAAAPTTIAGIQLTPAVIAMAGGLLAFVVLSKPHGGKRSRKKRRA